MEGKCGLMLSARFYTNTIVLANRWYFDRDLRLYI